jgi:type I restriction enzyme M protein
LSITSATGTPPEPHDVRAHLAGGVPVAEVMDKRSLFEAVGFSPAHAFARREKDPAYDDFAPAVPDRAAIRPLVEGDPGVQARHAAVNKWLAGWWTKHAPQLAELPQRRNLNNVRAEFLDSFVASLLQHAGGAPPLDRFKLAGVIATWWTDTLPDLKTLLENGFPGVIDGWVDAIADAIEDDEAVGPVSDPFSHKLVRRTMADYLERITATKAEIAEIKGEKEAFEQSNAPEDLEDEELAAWNYAKELERQIRDLKAEYREELNALAKLERAAAKVRATAEQKLAAAEAKRALRAFFGQLADLEAVLAPYELIKNRLAQARARYRHLMNEFVNELRSRCQAFTDDQKQALVLDLFAQDIQDGINAALAEKRQYLFHFIERLWDKYRETLTNLRTQRDNSEEVLAKIFSKLGYL